MSCQELGMWCEEKKYDSEGAVLCRFFLAVHDEEKLKLHSELASNIEKRGHE